MTANADTAEPRPISNLVPFTAWREALSISLSTGHRYRRRGMITVENIFGKLYVTREEIARFEQRASQGEFARARGRPLKARAEVCVE